LKTDAKAVFVDFYNRCGEAALETGEHEEAAWCKLTGYAARLALVGQLARDPCAEAVAGDIMQASCDLARWFGNEAVRIYAALAETSEQREQREMIEFVERRGGEASVRDVTHGCWAYRNKAVQAERVLNALVRNGSGKWQDPKPGSRGQPARKFRLITVLTITTNPGIYEGKPPVTGDGDAPSNQKIAEAGSPAWGAVSGDLSAQPEEKMRL
jgi:hypothetical protein